MRIKLRMDDNKIELLAALERITNKQTIHIKKGSKISQANVIRETGKSPEQIKLARYPSVVAVIKETQVKNKQLQAIKEQRAKHSRRSLSKRLADAEAQRNQLASIVDAQNNYIIELLDKIELLETGVTSVS